MPAFLTNLSIYLDIAGPLLGLLYCFAYRGEKAEGFSYIIAFLVCQLLTNATAKIMMLAGSQNNIVIYTLNALLGFVTVCAWFINHFKKKLSPQASKYLLLYLAASMVILITILLLENTGNGLNSLSLSFTALTICILAIIFFLLVFLHPYNEKLLRTSQFWIVTTFFAYYAPCFFIFLTYKILHKERESNFTFLWLTHNRMLFVCCILLAFFSKKNRLWKS